MAGHTDQLVQPSVAHQMQDSANIDSTVLRKEPIYAQNSRACMLLFDTLYYLTSQPSF